MANKTKNELLDEIKVKNDEIKKLEDEVKKLEKFKQYADTTDELAAMRDSFVASGFTKAEAFELVKLIVTNAYMQQSNTYIQPPKVTYRSYR